MEQLQRLAETIADVYIRDLKRESGDNVITIDGVSATIHPEMLASGLIDNVVYFAKEKHGDAYYSHAYNDLKMLINVVGVEYSLTSGGISVINGMIANAIKKKSKINMH